MGSTTRAPRSPPPQPCATGDGCRLFEITLAIAADDLLPRLAWNAEGPAAAGVVWWRLPAGAEGVVDELSPLESAEALARAHIDPAKWSTDFTRWSADPAEVLDTGTGRDLIAAIREPRYETVAEAESWLSETEAVQVVVVGDEARAYPLRVTIWHEIVNDVLGGEPVLVTYCPLCNTGLAFERRVGVWVPEFLTTGTLRFSNLIMYDDRTKSWWQQSDGAAIAGEIAGLGLRPIPSRLTSWAEFKNAHPAGTVLSRFSGFDRDYGFNPYLGYDAAGGEPDFYLGSYDDRRVPLSRVLGVRIGAEAVAFPFATLEFERVVETEIGGLPIVVFHRRGTSSALDSFQVSAGRDVGSAAAYDAAVDGQLLTFRHEGGRFYDNETGTEWSLLGLGIAGPLAGERLRPLTQDNGFWFAWAAFNPDTTLYKSDVTVERPAG